MVDHGIIGRVMITYLMISDFRISRTDIKLSLEKVNHRAIFDVSKSFVLRASISKLKSRSESV